MSPCRTYVENTISGMPDGSILSPSHMVAGVKSCVTSPASCPPDRHVCFQRAWEPVLLPKALLPWSCPARCKLPLRFVMTIKSAPFGKADVNSCESERWLNASATSSRLLMVFVSSSESLDRSPEAVGLLIAWPALLIQEQAQADSCTVAALSPVPAAIITETATHGNPKTCMSAWDHGINSVPCHCEFLQYFLRCLEL